MAARRVPVVAKSVEGQNSEVLQQEQIGCKLKLLFAVDYMYVLVYVCVFYSQTNFCLGVPSVVLLVIVM